MDIHPVTDPDDLPRKVDAIRDMVTDLYLIPNYRERLRAMNISDAANRIGAQMAKHGYPWPEEEWLLETARIVLDGYDGVMPEQDSTKNNDVDTRRRTMGNPTDSRTAATNQLVLERKDQRPQPDIHLRGGGVVSVTPPIDEDFWLFRVRLSPKQAIVGFPKFGTIGIGFARETDWNTNLPYTSDAKEIFAHIRHNKGSKRIADADCIAAIKLVQAAAFELKGR